MEVFMAVVGNVANCAWEATRVAQHVGNWLVDGPKNVFSNIDPLTDLLKLVQRINDIFKPIADFPPLKQIADSFSHITDFVNARNFIGRISDIVTGKAGWDKPFSKNFPDLLKIASKCAYLIGDFAATAKWLSSIHILGAWVKDSTAQMRTWGKEFNILKGIGDVACVTGSLLNFADTVRLIVQESMRDGYFKSGQLKLSLLADHVVEIACDTAKIAAAVLSNIPGVNIIFTMISLAVASTLSLGKFFKKTYCIESELHLPIEDLDESAGTSSVEEMSSSDVSEGAGDVGNLDELPDDFEDVVSREFSGAEHMALGGRDRAFSSPEVEELQSHHTGMETIADQGLAASETHESEEVLSRAVASPVAPLLPVAEEPTAVLQIPEIVVGDGSVAPAASKN
jgi:hypothetical protein